MRFTARFGGSAWPGAGIAATIDEAGVDSAAIDVTGVCTTAIARAAIGCRDADATSDITDLVAKTTGVARVIGRRNRATRDDHDQS